MFNVLKPSPGNVQEIQDLSTRVTALASGDSWLGLLPGRFPAHTLTALASPEKSHALRPLVELTAIAAAAFIVSIAVAERIYLSGWTRSATQGRKGRRAKWKPRPGRALNLIWRGTPAAERAILATTARLLAREPQQITPVATIVIMMSLFPFLMSRGALMRPEVFLYSLSMVSFAGSLNLATNALLIHGRSFWHLLAAPVPATRSISSLLALPALFFIPLTAILALVFRLAGVVAWPFVPKAVALSACLSVLGSSIGLFVGAAFGDWEWDTPKRMLNASGRFVALGIVMLLFAAMGIALGSLTKANALSEAEITWPVLAAAAAVAGLITYPLLLASSARIRRMEWTA
jgi:hypothetical protein